MYLTNAFSLNMLDSTQSHRLGFMPVSLDEAREILIASGYTSAVGHPGTAPVLSAQLGLMVPFNRISVTLAWGDEMVIAQATMPRLTEGQVLSEAEMAAVPVQYWKVVSHSGA